MLDEIMPLERCLELSQWRRIKKKSNLSTTSQPTSNSINSTSEIPVTSSTATPSTKEQAQSSAQVPTETPVVKAAASTQAIPNTLSTPSISLKNIGKSSKPEYTKPVEEEAPDQNIVINEETFHRLWAEYTQILKDQGNTNTYTVFINTKPIKVEDGWLHISYSNALQESILLEAKWELQEFFAKKLDGLRIGIKNVLVQEAVDPTKKVLYTDEDKLRYLSEKHPLVDELKKRMGLDPNN